MFQQIRLLAPSNKKPQKLKEDKKKTNGRITIFSTILLCVHLFFVVWLLWTPPDVSKYSPLILLTLSINCINKVVYYAITVILQKATVFPRPFRYICIFYIIVSFLWKRCKLRMAFNTRNRRILKSPASQFYLLYNTISISYI